MSLQQMHHYRSRRWIAVRGTAKVPLNDKVKVIWQIALICIPVGASNRLENPGKIPFEFIEVQIGSYRGEDDIVRIKDNYKCT